MVPSHGAVAVEAFLQRAGGSLAQLLEQARRELRLGPADALMAVGSISEGLANDRSDLDLLWITRRPSRASTGEDTRTLIVGGAVVDVEVCPADRITGLATRLAAWSELPWSLARAADFTHFERRLAHRLLNGLVIRGSERAGVLGKLPSPRDLARLKLHAARHEARTIQVDLAGYRSDRDYRTLVFGAQELLGHAVDAVLAAYGLTNPTPKWRGKLLKRLPADWERALGVRPSGLGASELCWSLHRAPGVPSRAACLAHALRITNFARAAFVWSERRLLRGASGKLSRARRAGRSRTSRGQTLPSLDLDVDFAWVGRGASVARLNAFGDLVEVSERELELCLLFDGATTSTEACTQVFGSSAAPQLEAASRLAERLAAAKLTLAPRRGEA